MKKKRNEKRLPWRIGNNMLDSDCSIVCNSDMIRVLKFEPETVNRESENWAKI